MPSIKDQNNNLAGGKFEIFRQGKRILKYGGSLDGQRKAGPIDRPRNFADGLPANIFLSRPLGTVLLKWYGNAYKKRQMCETPGPARGNGVT